MKMIINHFFLVHYYRAKSRQFVTDWKGLYDIVTLNLTHQSFGF